MRIYIYTYNIKSIERTECINMGECDWRIIISLYFFIYLSGKSRLK